MTLVRKGCDMNCLHHDLDMLTHPAPPPSTQVVGPAGWHMHSFASTAHALYKMFSRAGHYSSVLHPDMQVKALQHRQHCSEVETPSPHAVPFTHQIK